MQIASSVADATTHDSPPRRRGASRALYLIPSSLTLASVLCGWYGIVNAIKGITMTQDPAGAAKLFVSAAAAIGLAIILDNLDGRIARTIGATSAFGVELDSLADILTFGGAATVLAYASAYGAVPGLEGPAFAISFLFVASGAIRLARSNVHANTPRTTTEEERFFVGLPIPAAAGVLAAFTYAYYSPVAGGGTAPGDLRSYSLLLMGTVIVLSLLMVSTFPYSKLKFARNRRPTSVINRLTFPLVATAGVLGVLLNGRGLVVTLALLYAIHGPVLGAVQRLIRTRS